MPHNDEFRVNLSVAVARWEASSDQDEKATVSGVIAAAQALLSALQKVDTPAGEVVDAG